MRKPVMLDDYQIQQLADLVYEEYDRVTSGSTVYANNEETAHDLRELLDLLKEAKDE